ncbi:MAG: cytochrome c oxidase assembly protein [Caldilineaceae bacterium]|nr:cytochrome c oxidase assembly protein [Caldilineaceae bacterium]
MDPITKALLLSWDVRFEILLPLTLLGAFQFIGWRRLRQRGVQRFANGWRLASYFAGLALLILALLSPIDVLSGQLFAMHMIQHLLLVMVVPPLLWLAGPFATGLWALPRPMRLRIGGWFQQESRFRQLLRLTTQPGLSWLLFVGILFGWHDPTAYSLAQGNGWIHDLEHLSFFGSAMLFWWRVVGAGPHIHGKSSLLFRIGYVLGVVPPNMFLGVAIALAESPIYTYYLSVPRLYGISVLDDQMIAGLIMWIPGSMMYIAAALVLVARLFINADRRNDLPKDVAMGAVRRTPHPPRLATNE